MAWLWRSAVISRTGALRSSVFLQKFMGTAERTIEAKTCQAWRRPHPPARARDNSTAPAGLIQRAESRGPAPLLSDKRTLQACRTGLSGGGRGKDASTVPL